MEQYIPKSALIAEAEKRIKTNKECMLGLRNLDYYQGKVDALNEVLAFLDTLEVKEVDLDEEFDRYCANLYLIDLENEPYAELFECAKYFYELGLKAKGK